MNRSDYIKPQRHVQGQVRNATLSSQRYGVIRVATHGQARFMERQFSEFSQLPGREAKRRSDGSGNKLRCNLEVEFVRPWRTRFLPNSTTHLRRSLYIRTIHRSLRINRRQVGFGQLRYGVYPLLVPGMPSRRVWSIGLKTD